MLCFCLPFIWIVFTRYSTDETTRGVVVVDVMINRSAKVAPLLLSNEAIFPMGSASLSPSTGFFIWWTVLFKYFFLYPFFISMKRLVTNWLDFIWLWRSYLKPVEHRWVSSKWTIRNWSFCYTSWRHSWPSSPSSNHLWLVRLRCRAVWPRNFSSTCCAIDPVLTECSSSASSRTVSFIYSPSVRYGVCAGFMAFSCPVMSHLVCRR